MCRHDCSSSSSLLQIQKLIQVEHGVAQVGQSPKSSRVGGFRNARAVLPGAELSILFIGQGLLS